MGITVNFNPNRIDFGSVPPGGGVTPGTLPTQSGTLSAPVNVTASIKDDASGGAFTVSAVTSFAMEDTVMRGFVTVQKGESNGVTPLAVASGQYVVVTIEFKPTASTPDVCPATLVIEGNTWSPVSIPITATVSGINVSVPAITVEQGESAQANVTIALASGPATEVKLTFDGDLSTVSPTGILSLNQNLVPISEGAPATVVLTANANATMAVGSYSFYLAVSAYEGHYNTVIPIVLNVKPRHFFIKSKLSGNVIDIQGASSAAGALLDAFPQKSVADNQDNQLWEFIPDPAGSGYYFIKSQLSGNVIDIQQNSTVPGTLLDAFTQKTSNNANQLWEFVADPAGSGYFFIVSRLSGNVIDIQQASTSAGALLDAYPWKLTGYDNQLWKVVDGGFPSVVETVPVPPGGYSGSGNYILANGSSCATLTGVKATILFTDDLVWESQVVHPGFSIQLNAETNNNQTLDWLQFVVHMGDDQGLWPWINIWKGGSNPQIIWNQQVANPVATMPQAQRIPKGYSIIIALQNDSDGRVTGAIWNVLDASGNSVGSVNYGLSTTDGGGVPPGDLSPVASFQVTFGGALGGAHATFSSGAGVIICQANQPMNVDTSYPTCIGFIGGTAETSNMGYGALGAQPNTLFSQAFGVVPDSAQVRQAKPNARKRTAPSVKLTAASEK